jgi:hypothetical protein
VASLISNENLPIEGLRNSWSNKMQTTIYGAPRQTWANIHDDYKSVINGVKYVTTMDETGATVLMPYKQARERKLI